MNLSLRCLPSRDPDRQQGDPQHAGQHDSGWAQTGAQQEPDHQSRRKEQTDPDQSLDDG